MSLNLDNMSLADVLKVLPSLSESDQRVLEAQLAKLEELKEGLYRMVGDGHTADHSPVGRIVQ